MIKRRIQSKIFRNYASWLREEAFRLVCRVGEKGPPYDPFEVARLLDVDVVLRGAMDGIDGYVERIGTRWQVVLSRDANRRRSRFTLGHELGHLILMRGADNGDSRGLMRYRTNRAALVFHQDPMEESLCNMFASELLMPRRDIENQVCSACLQPESITRAAKIFDVSLQTSATKILRTVGNWSHACTLWDLKAAWLIPRWHLGVKTRKKEETMNLESVIAAAGEQGESSASWARFGMLDKPATIACQAIYGGRFVLAVMRPSATMKCNHPREPRQLSFLWQ